MQKKAAVLMLFLIMVVVMVMLEVRERVRCVVHWMESLGVFYFVIFTNMILEPVSNWNPELELESSVMRK